MTGIISQVALVLLCTLITTSTAQQAFPREASDKNQTMMANLINPKQNVSIRHSTFAPSPKFPLLTKHSTRFLRRRHPKLRRWLVLASLKVEDPANKHELVQTSTEVTWHSNFAPSPKLPLLTKHSTRFLQRRHSKLRNRPTLASLKVEDPVNQHELVQNLAKTTTVLPRKKISQEVRDAYEEHRREKLRIDALYQDRLDNQVHDFYQEEEEEEEEVPQTFNMSPLWRRFWLR